MIETQAKPGRGESGSVTTVSYHEIRKRIGMVFQNYELIPHKTALGNVMAVPNGVLSKPRK